MAEEKVYDAGIIWKGRGEHIYGAMVSLDVETAREMFEDGIESGFVSKNDGSFYGSISPGLTRQQFNELFYDDEAMNAIARGEDERFVVTKIDSYEVSPDEWSETSKSRIYPPGSEGGEVFI